MTKQAAPRIGKKRLCIPSGGIRKIPHLSAFLPEFDAVTGQSFKTCDAVAGWGRKPTSIRAQKLAQKKAVPYIALEDGFLRSFGLGVDGAQPFSLVLDRTGIYYDSENPSDLETLIAHGGFSAEKLARAENAMARIKAEKLCKYNKGLIRGTVPLPRIRRLIIDQTANDASVTLSGAAPDAFARMIEDALKTYQPHEIAVKLHPDTLTGKKGGYLKNLAEQQGIRLIGEPYNPWDLLYMTYEVSTFSSLLGFDALMHGRRVLCYGMPFYAGWGLTDDKFACPRRQRRAGIGEIFAAAYIDYARYIDPYTGTPSTLEETIDLLSDLVRYEQKTNRPAIAIGFSAWKKSFIPLFAGGKGQVRFRRRAPKQHFHERIIVWAGKRDALIAAGKLKETAAITRMEDGFIRSKGLGAKLVRPWSLVLDDSGIYYDPRQPSDLETILETAEIGDALQARAEKLRRLLLDNNMSKYNTGRKSRPDIGADGRTVILVPGQVEDDASIKTGTVGIKTNFDLLKAVRANNPGAFILYKPHPDVEAGKRVGQVAKADAMRHCDMIVGGYSIASLWPVVDEVHTMTSLSGFEGLLRHKKVHCYGIPFYAGWGLTQDYYKAPRRTRKLTINSLVAGTLILYPLYFDWKTYQLTTAETVIRRLAALK